MENSRPSGKQPLTVLIAGAGIGGLTAAISCAAKGFAVTVLEQADQIAEMGGGIQLQPNATRVLLELGLSEKLSETGVHPERLSLRAAKTGRIITRVSLDKTIDALPYYQIHRADLQHILLEKAQTLGARIITNAQVKDYRQDSQQVCVHTHSNQIYKADVLIGADGVRSGIRAQIFKNDPDTAKAIFTGQVCYRGVVDASRLKLEIEPGAIVGEGRHFVCYYLRNRQLVNVVAQYEASEWTEESWTIAADADELREMYRDWDPQVTEILENVEKTFKWALCTRPALPRWSDQRVCLIGDACHPTLPNLASGAAMAIEDAYIIAELLSDSQASVPDVLQAFYDLRIERCTRIQKASARMANFFHTRNPVEKAAKHSAVRLLSRIAPTVVARQLTWTHGYDAVTAVSTIKEELS